MSDKTEAVETRRAVPAAAVPGASGAAAGTAGIAAAMPGTNVPPPATPAAGVSVAGAPAVPAPGAPVGAEAGGSPEVRRAHFQPLQADPGAGGRDNIGLLMDVVVTMTVELGGASLPLKEVLKLGAGSVVRLERALGEPVDILINRELVGRGEVVVVDDRFGVRVTELVDPKVDKP